MFERQRQTERRLRREEKIKQARREFNATLDHVIREAMAGDTRGGKSYVPNASQAVETSNESASTWVRDRLHLEVAHRPIQRVVHDCTQAVEELREFLPPPADEKGSLLIHTADCKGIPMRPTDRNPEATKSEDKPGEKRMAGVARGYSIDPHMRPDETIVESFFKKGRSGTAGEKEPRRPKPSHRRTVASLKQSKSQVFDRSERAVKSRAHAGTQERAVLMDGERALWNLSRDRFPDWIEILDFNHVMEKLWIAGHLHYGKQLDHIKEYVHERALLLLEGEVGLVIEDLIASLEDGTLSKGKAHELRSKVVGYFRNNRHRMHYSDYLAKGLPIATGIVESTCKSLINRRMEGAVMLWSVDGAEAMVKLRGIFLDKLWDDFWIFRAQREKKRICSACSGVREMGSSVRQLGKAA